jgi:hypothetical protein
MMMVQLYMCIFGGILLYAAAELPPADPEQSFSAWARSNARAYAGSLAVPPAGKNAEWRKREAVWRANMQAIAAHNVQHAAGNRSYTMGSGPFTDWTAGEYRQMASGWVGGAAARCTQAAKRAAPAANKSKDWSAEGAVTAVKAQWDCGVCHLTLCRGTYAGTPRVPGVAFPRVVTLPLPRDRLHVRIRVAGPSQRLARSRAPGRSRAPTTSCSR